MSEEAVETCGKDQALLDKLSAIRISPLRN